MLYCSLILGCFRNRWTIEIPFHYTPLSKYEQIPNAFLVHRSPLRTLKYVPLLEFVPHWMRAGADFPAVKYHKQIQRNQWPLFSFVIFLIRNYRFSLLWRIFLVLSTSLSIFHFTFKPALFRQVDSWWERRYSMKRLNFSESHKMVVECGFFLLFPIFSHSFVVEILEENIWMTFLRNNFGEYFNKRKEMPEITCSCFALACVKHDHCFLGVIFCHLHKILFRSFMTLLTIFFFTRFNIDVNFNRFQCKLIRTDFCWIQSDKWFHYTCIHEIHRWIFV